MHTQTVHAVDTIRWRDGRSSPLLGNMLTGLTTRIHMHTHTQHTTRNINIFTLTWPVADISMYYVYALNEHLFVDREHIPQHMSTRVLFEVCSHFYQVKISRSKGGGNLYVLVRNLSW